jgi:hypothetical protein
MKVNNQTNYQTNDLKKLFTRVMQHNIKFEGSCNNFKYLIVKVVHSKGCGLGGNATLNGYNMLIKLPKQNIQKELCAIAYIFDHELQHIRGYHHREMQRGWKRNWKEEYTFADSYIIRIKEQKIKPKQDLQIKRYEHAKTMLKDKIKRIKRLMTLKKKWSQKVKYYEQVLVQCGKMKKENL